MQRFFKPYLLILSIFILPQLLKAQDTLAGWSFPNGQPGDTLANFHTTLNVGKVIHTAGGVSSQMTFTNGATSFAATASGWDNGSGSKCWMVEVSTFNYHNLRLSSKQRSGGNNPGPRDFKVEYKIGLNGNWADVPGTNLTLAGDWSAELVNVPLPSDCISQTETVYLRWVMRSDTNSQGNIVSAAGITKIDDIFIKGEVATGLPELTEISSHSVFPNPAREFLTIRSSGTEASIKLINSQGQLTSAIIPTSAESRLDLRELPEGIYFLQFIYNSGRIITKKVIISNSRGI